MRAGQEFVLRSLVNAARHFNGDYTRAAIWLAINSASTGHLLDDSDFAEAFDDEASAPPEPLRRPISRLAISQGLGIPFETVRRHCKVLLREGWCKEVKGRGLIVAVDGRLEEIDRHARRDNATAVRRFLRRLGAEIHSTDR